MIKSKIKNIPAKFYTLILLVLFASLNLLGQQIPESVLKGSDAIYLLDDNVIDVKNNTAIITTRRTIRVLNDNGVEHGHLLVYYQKNTPINYIKGTVYDANGKKVKEIGKKDIKDYSMVSSYSLFEDYRVKNVEIHYPLYPYSIEYEYQQTLNGFISLPTWTPQDDYRIGVVNATLKLTFPNSEPVNYKAINISESSIQISKKESTTQISCKLENLKPVQSEPYSENLTEKVPVLMLVPKCFVFHGSSGCFNSWNDYGKWVQNLLTDRDKVSAELSLKLKDITKESKNKHEKVKLLYKYLQSQTRYVSVQLGIGGFQPFPASDVEKYGYGDCKALSNYMMALLSEVGIKSHYTEIGINNRHIVYEEFPSASQTDHVILMVPIQGDTIWLECTSQRYPFGYLSHRHQGQKVLVVGDNGGEIHKIPNLGETGNKQIRIGTFQLDKDGNAKGSLKTRCFGGEMGNLMPELWLSDKERLEILNKKYTIPNFKITEFRYNLNEDTYLFADESIDFTLDKIASKTGKRFFLNLNTFGLVPKPPAKAKERNSNLIQKYSYSYADSLIYIIPEGYQIEGIPKNTEIESPFGSFKTKFYIDSNKIVFTKKYSFRKNTFPAEKFNEFVDFMMLAHRNENISIILIEKALN